MEELHSETAAAPKKSSAEMCKCAKKSSKGRAFMWIVAAASFLHASVAAAGVPDPYIKPEHSFISLGGTILEVKKESFILDYRKGKITVEVDDWDQFDEASNFRAGEEVIVNGRIDDGVFEKRTIEASSIYSPEKNTYFYASAIDDESLPREYLNYYSHILPRDGNFANVTGVVTGIDISTFTIRAKGRSIVVDIRKLAYNPFDKKGLQQIKVGDKVSVAGHLDKNFLEKDRILASSVTSLIKVRLGKV